MAKFEQLEFSISHLSKASVSRNFKCNNKNTRLMYKIRLRWQNDVTDDDVFLFC